MNYAPGISWNKMEDQVVILDARGKRYFHEFNTVASFLWESLPERSESDLITLLENEYQIDHAIATNDVSEFIAELKQKDLIV